MPGESKSSQRRIKARERQSLALELRKTGATFDAIAKELDYRSRQAAAFSVNAALKRITQEPAEELRALDIERLDSYLLSLNKRIKDGDTFAINTALSILARRAKLLGLDMPIKQELSGEVFIADKKDISKVPTEVLKATIAEVERNLGIPRN